MRHDLSVTPSATQCGNQVTRLFPLQHRHPSDSSDSSGQDPRPEAGIHDFKNHALLLQVLKGFTAVFHVGLEVALLCS